MQRKHVIISGTGRAGTTFLVQLLTLLGLDTGFSDISSHVYENCNAGMEWDIRHPGAPYIVKNPWLCDHLDEALQSGDIVIEHAIIPIRNLFQAAESRRDVERRSQTEPGQTPGGLWLVEKPEDQEIVLTRQLYKLIHTLAKWSIPATLLHFPEFAQSPEYLYRQISFLLKAMPYREFAEAFEKVARPNLIHHYQQQETRDAVA